MRISLRIKLALISLLLLLIPVIGFRFGETLKSSLLTSREDTLKNTARAISLILSNQSSLFKQDLYISPEASRDIYSFKLNQPIKLDGRITDWKTVISQAKTYGAGNPSLSFQLVTGTWGKDLFVLLVVHDDHVVYRGQDALELENSDHVQVMIDGQDGSLDKYVVTKRKNDYVAAYRKQKIPTNYPGYDFENKIWGGWRQNNAGYILEIRIPLSYIGNKIAFTIVDVDDEDTREIENIIGTANTDRSEELGVLVARSKGIESILENLNMHDIKIDVIDRRGQRRGGWGNFSSEPNDLPSKGRLSSVTGILHKLLRPIYTFFTEPFSPQIKEAELQSAKLAEEQGVPEALQHGRSSVLRYLIEDGKVEVMRAIEPIRYNKQVVGAVVVEKTTNSILAMKNRFIEESITLTVLAFLLGGGSLLLFASRLSSRIRKLRDQAAKAISRDGRVVDSIKPLKAKDEIGDLSRTLSSTLHQLRQQVEYREKMADNLEHEMRTPLAGVSASLKNLSQEIDTLSDQGREYVQWALNDIKRLEELLSAIRDATTLQEALEQDFQETFDLNEAVSVWVNQGWKQSFPGNNFEFAKKEGEIFLHGDPTRIRQMLDKLVENAVDFSDASDPIEINIEKKSKEIWLQVSNLGPPIDESILGQIFNSLVSFRERKENKLHLGLGLYIVRKIAEYHGGKVEAGALTGDRAGAVFTVKLPT